MITWGQTETINIRKTNKQQEQKHETQQQQK